MDSRIGIVLCALRGGIEGGFLTKAPRREGWDDGFLCELGALRRSRARDRNFWTGLTGSTGLKKGFSRRDPETQREDRLGGV